MTNIQLKKTQRRMFLFNKALLDDLMTVSYCTTCKYLNEFDRCTNGVMLCSDEDSFDSFGCTKHEIKVEKND